MAAALWDYLFGGTHDDIKSKAELSVDDAVNVGQTGDILLFRGWSSTSSFIQTLTASTWSHIALIIRLPDMNEGKPMVLEAIHSDDDHARKSFKPLLDVVSQKARCGVRLVDMNEYLVSILAENRAMAHTKSIKRIEIVMRSLILPEFADSIQHQFTQHLNTVAAEFIEKNRGKKYEENFLEIIMARLQLLDTAGILTPKTLFCSELVGYFLYKAGLISLEYTTPNSLLPDDFSSSNHMALRYPIESVPSFDIQVSDPDDIVKYSREYVILTVSQKKSKRRSLLRILNCE